MVDIFSGPNAPLALAFKLCGWRATAWDRLISPSHDLTVAEHRQSLAQHCTNVTLVAAALPCDTKTRIREIPRFFPDGRPTASPLRSEEYPEGLPHLRGADRDRIARDNLITDFVLELQQQQVQRNLAAIRENPTRSLQWWQAKEVEMWSSGKWMEKCYAACSLMGARCKQQTLRHCIPEIDQWPPVHCNHLHAKDEWHPYSLHGKQHYPSKEEAEYTASLCFLIAVTTSWWAVRTGHAKLKLPRIPQPMPHGERISWLHINPKATREWAMLPTAIQLGISVQLTSGCALPARQNSEELNLVARDKKPAALADNFIYVGHGWHKHRLRTTKWASPYRVGQHGTAEECMVLYANHLRTSGLIEDIDELQGKTLVCDTPQTEAAPADVLIAELCAHHLDQQGRSREAATTRWGGQPRRKWPALVQQLLMIAHVTHATQAIPPEVQVRWRQDSVFRAFASLYPEHCFRHMQFPFIEDIINQPPFTSYPEWVEAQAELGDEAFGPKIASKGSVYAERHSTGQQQGAFTHRAAMAQLISFQLNPDQHFSEARHAGSHPTPLEATPVADADLRFAADMMCTHYNYLEAARESNFKAFASLKHRWRPVTQRLRSYQTGEHRRVTAAQEIALLGLLVILMCWPDITLAYCTWCGFPAVGYNPWCAIFAARAAAKVGMAYVLEGAQEDAFKILRGMQPSSKTFTIPSKDGSAPVSVNHDDFVLEATLKDLSKGWCTPLMTWPQLHRAVQGRPVRLIPRIAIQQPSGKLRLIDNADGGGQTATTEDANQLRFCSALQPAVQVAVLWAAKQKVGNHIPCQEGVLTGGDDWPDAYREKLQAPADAEGCIVTFWHPQQQMPVFVIYHSLLFGNPNSVTSFNRFPKFMEAVVRRFVWILFSMYFDDATIQDWQHQSQQGQRDVQRLMTLLGSPFSPEKRQPMSTRADFLGLEHNTESVAEHGYISFWVRERIEQKINDMMAQAEQGNLLSAGTASKLYGTANFWETGTFGKIGRAGLNAIKDRQHSKEMRVTADIQRSFQILRAINAVQPKRIVAIRDTCDSRFCAASDAAYEAAKGSGGYLIVTLPMSRHEQRIGCVVQIPSQVYSLWGDHETYIAQLELMMILAAILRHGPKLKHTKGIWFVDNVAALMALVRGRSNEPALDHMALLIHAALFVLHAVIYFEWVESGANWSDGISREGLQDSWHRQNHFSSEVAVMPYPILGLSIKPALKMFEYLFGPA